MEQHFINYNQNNTTPVCGFMKHYTIDAAKKEAVRIMKREGCEIHIYQYVGTVKPVPEYVFEEPGMPF